MGIHLADLEFLLGSVSLKPQDAFATTTYTGDDAIGRMISTGLDMAGKGGLTWTKRRDVSADHGLVDTQRGRAAVLKTSLTDAETTNSPSDRDVMSFEATGHKIGPGFNSTINSTGASFVNWSFRRAPKFFDTVTYTGNGVAGRQIAHNLGVAPGMIIVKARSGVSQWIVWHRDANGGNAYLTLNSTNAQATDNGAFFGSGSYSAPSASAFTVSNNANVNANGTTYVAYIFAQNPDLIDCGSYIGNSSTSGPIVTCGSGWKPQWLMVKDITAAGTNWVILDVARSASNPRNSYLAPNSSSAETTSTSFNIDFLSTGFQPTSAGGNLNFAGDTLIYMAIREPLI